MFDTHPCPDDFAMCTGEGIRGKVVNTLRMLSVEEKLKGQTVLIPDGVERYGLLEGYYDLPSLLYFIADMVE